MDKVSIILAFYNEELTITDCLNSLVNQTYKNIELILVDDSSTDKSTFIARDFERRYDFIKYFRIEHRDFIHKKRFLAMVKKLAPRCDFSYFLTKNNVATKHIIVPKSMFTICSSVSWKIQIAATSIIKNATNI